MVSADVSWNHQSIYLDNVLLDTGSTGTIFSAEKLAEIGLLMEENDVIRQIYGVGGTEFVFVKCISTLHIGHLCATDFNVEVGALEYGFTLDDIIGTNFLQHTHARIDFSSLEIL